LHFAFIHFSKKSLYFADQNPKHGKNRGHQSVAGEEEDLAELRNLEFNHASKPEFNIMFFISFFILSVLA